MRRLLAVAALVIVFGSISPAQTWDNFFHPRPPIERTEMIALTQESTFIWEFKPTFTVVATSFRSSMVEGKSFDVGLFSGAGPALTLQKSGQYADGTNYALYSFSAAFIMTGNTQADPNFQPAVVVQAGLLNNIINIGAGHDLVTRTDTKNGWFFVMSVGVNITNN